MNLYFKENCLLRKKKKAAQLSSLFLGRRCRFGQTHTGFRLGVILDRRRRGFTDNGSNTIVATSTGGVLLATPNYLTVGGFMVETVLAGSVGLVEPVGAAICFYRGYTPQAVCFGGIAFA